MKQVQVVVSAMILLLGSVFAQAQQTVATNTNVAVPPLVNFSGTLTDANGRPLTGSVAVTFSLYSEQSGGAALWMESQNVQPDRSGHYTVMLGSTSSSGLPAEIFVAGQAHWLGVQVQGEQEQPRVLLVSAPYALKAGDAQTLGGLPASAFVLAAPVSGNATATANDASPAMTPSSAPPPASSDVTTTGGTVDAIPLFSTATNIQNSIITQTGTSSINVAGKLNLPSLGTSTSSAGYNSRPLDFVASSYDSGTTSALAETFQWQAQATGNDTSSPSATLNLLFGSGTSTPTQTGLNIASTGLITFAKGQTFPGTGDGTITGVTTAAGSGLSGGGTSGTLSLSLMTGCSTNQVLQWNGSKWACSSAGAGTITGVTAGTGLTGGGTSGSVTLTNTGLLAVTAGTGISSTGGQSPTLSINTSVVPELSAANTFVGNQTITGDLTVNYSGTAEGLVVDAPSAYYGLLVYSDAVGAAGTAVATGGDGVIGTATNGNGVYGIDNATSGASIGVYGQTDSTDTGAVGVYGLQDAASGLGYGVFGQSNGSGSYGVGGTASYVGVYGSAAGQSNTAFFFGGNAGVHGDTGGATGLGYRGVSGTADDNNAGSFTNNSGSDTSSGGAALLAENLSDDVSAMVFWAGDSSDYCNVNVGGHLSCTGGTDAVVPVDHGARRVTLHAVQSAENWFEDFGSATLVNGVARVALDPTFASTVSTTTEYHVFLTPRGECEGLYVAATTSTEFEVRELHGGTSGAAFDYRIVAKRAGYEKNRLEDVTEWYRKNQELSRLRREQMQQRRAARAAAALATPSAGKVVAPPVVPAPNIARPIPHQR